MASSNVGEDPVPGGTLRFAVLDAPTNLDPHSGSSYPESLITGNISDKLVYQNPESGALEPWLATSWDVNETLTEFTFHLRNDVTFSDGTPLSADSVKENFDLLGFGNKELGVVPVSAYWGGYLRTEVIDPSTVKVTLDKPSAVFLQGLSMYFAGILGHTTLQLRKEDRALPQNIVATGPFVVTEHVYQEKTVLRKREGYNWEPASRGHNGAAAYTRSSWLSQAIASLPAAGVSVPVFLVGLAILQVFSFQLRWFPPIGNDGFASLVLPAVTLAIPVSAPIAQLLLKNIELGLNAPYVTVSVAKGASRLWVLVRDVLENASLPALTIAGLTLGNLPAGAAHVERRRGLVRQ